MGDRACATESNGDEDSSNAVKRGTQLLEIFALQILMHSKQRDKKKLRWGVDVGWSHFSDRDWKRGSNGGTVGPERVGLSPLVLLRICMRLWAQKICSPRGGKHVRAFPSSKGPPMYFGGSAVGALEQISVTYTRTFSYIENISQGSIRACPEDHIGGAAPADAGHNS